MGSWMLHHHETLRRRQLMNEALLRLKARELNRGFVQWLEILQPTQLSNGLYELGGSVSLPPPPSEGEVKAVELTLCKALETCLACNVK